MVRSDLHVDHTSCCQTPCAYKNITGLLQLMAKGMFGLIFPTDRHTQ